MTSIAVLIGILAAGGKGIMDEENEGLSDNSLGVFWPFEGAFDCCMHWDSWLVRIPLFLVGFIPLVMLFYVLFAIGNVLEGMKH